MEIKRVGSQASGRGPAEHFTGTVRVDPLFEAHAPARALGSSVTFEPGARTAWHTHPLGPNAHRHSRLWLDSTRRWVGRGDPTRRCGLVLAGRETLARRDANNGNDPYRHSGASRR